MKSDLYNGLQFTSVLDKVSRYASFDASIEALKIIELSYNPLEIKRNINMTSEAMELLRQEYSVDFYGIQDVTEYFKKASKGHKLSAYELLACLYFHNHCVRIKKVFDKIEELDVLKEYSDAITLNYDVFDKISKIVDPNAKISKDASIKLKELYDKDESISKEINAKAKSFIENHGASLQENSIYYRDNRLSFLLKNSDKYKFDGFVHGHSSSGMAAYVEPKEFVHLNNSRSDLNDAIDKEIDKILIFASSLIGTCYNTYQYNFETLVLLDGVFAKAKYGIENGGILASIANDNCLYLDDIYHPLLDMSVAVSNTYSLNSDLKGIIISGANTGGKTVSLKLIGLSIVMTYLGIPLLCHEARVPLYDLIYIDIDDNQSLESSLSTFSSQLVKLDNILNHASNRSLVLIDEIGNGTEPKQAQALSIALVEKLLDINCKFVLTTHFDELKNYALNEPTIMISSVSFDSEKLIPTYKYVGNSIGSSNALAIAAKYLSDKHIIDRANEYLVENASKQEKLMKQLEEAVIQNEQLRNDLEFKINENEILIKQYQTDIEKLEKSKQAILLEYQEKLETYLEAKIEEANKIISSIGLNNGKKAIKDLEAVIEENQPEVVAIVDETLEVGDRVRIMSSEQIGTIISLNKSIAEVNLNGLRIKVKLKELQKMPSNKENKPSKQYSSQKRARVNKELVLVGMRVEEALPLLEKYLDDAYASKMPSVRIVHGIGTGTLRKAIHEKLARLKFIKNYHLADYYDGGSAITIVEF